MRVIFMGTPSYITPVLETLESLRYDVVGVYTQPDRPSGRGRVAEPSPVKSFALAKGLPVFQPASFRREEVQKELASLGPDLIVVAAYGKILPREVLDIPARECVNVHPSLLPRYRGPSPVAMAILEGEAVTGTTIMLMDEGMDTGPVLAARELEVQAGVWSTPELTQALFQIGAELLLDVLPRWVSGEIIPEPQDHGLATVTRKLEREDGEARWTTPAEELDRRLRAFTPWPGMFTYWKGRLLKIISAAPVPPRAQDSGRADDEVVHSEAIEPGEVVLLEEPGMAAGVVTGRGVLGLGCLQLEGRRSVTSEEFVRGYRDFPGSTLPS